MLQEILTWQKYFFGFDGFREILTNPTKIKSCQKVQNTKIKVFMFKLNDL
jgi:hypothetical protein